MRYRIYFLDQFGRFRGVEDIDCRDDSEAIAKAQQYPDAEQMELWDHARFIARIGRGPLRSVVPCGQSLAS
jgi:hypothetical protein